MLHILHYAVKRSMKEHRQIWIVAEGKQWHLYAHPHPHHGLKCLARVCGEEVVKAHREEYTT